MRSKGSRFTLGVWGLRVRPQPSATVRKRSRDCYMAVPMVSSAEGLLFGGFKRRVASFHVAGVALRDIQTCFINALRIVLCGRRNTFTTFSEDACQFSRQAQHFGRMQHFKRVVLRVFCESHWRGCARWRQGADSVAGLALCEMC